MIFLILPFLSARDDLVAGFVLKPTHRHHTCHLHQQLLLWSIKSNVDDVVGRPPQIRNSSTANLSVEKQNRPLRLTKTTLPINERMSKLELKASASPPEPGTTRRAWLQSAAGVAILAVGTAVAQPLESKATEAVLTSPSPAPVSPTKTPNSDATIRAQDAPIKNQMETQQKQPALQLSPAQPEIPIKDQIQPQQKQAALPVQPPSAKPKPPNQGKKGAETKPPSIITNTNQTQFIESVNFSKVAAENNINITLVSSENKACVTVDRRMGTKITKQDVPWWFPPVFRPKPKVEEIPDAELLFAGLVAGSSVEIARTSLLYPLGTVKARIQAETGRRISLRKRLVRRRLARIVAEQESSNATNVLKVRPKKIRLRIKRRLQILGLTFNRQLGNGNLYAGIAPTLLVSIPSTGVYFGVRDVTKRLLNKAIATPTRVDDVAIAVAGVFVADIISLIVRTPAELLSVRLQVGSSSENKNVNMTNDQIVGDWFTDSIVKLPAIIATDLPFLILKTTLNGFLVHGNEDLQRYEMTVIATACLCALLTTPLDVARTRILIDSDDDPTNGMDGGSGDALIPTLKQVMSEEGGASNLFRGWAERTAYLGLGRAWFDPISAIVYIAIRDAVLLQLFH